AEIGPPALNLTDSSPGSNNPGGEGSLEGGGPGGELERKIKLLEKERQTMRTETEGQQEKLNQGIDNGRRQGAGAGDK
ncbi:hypothetical protein KUCAC02_033446, partial [Chaenocephalus aceratus]